jgi:histidyl-tRNA synthetase
MQSAGYGIDMSKVHLPKGTRDLLPQQMNNRMQVIQTVRGVFERFGFQPLETPAFERIETLMGKYGDEGDKLIYRILKRGEGGKRGEVDLALRYDLTVPLARMMAMNPGLPLPFKRYQIQPVWRADRPQKGRFREFYQCDVDIIGTESRLAEAECLAVVYHCFSELGFSKFTIRLNDRRILHAMATAIGAEDQETSMLQAIDKLDKIGRDGVARELVARGFSEEQAKQLFAMLDGETIPGTSEVEAELDQVVQSARALGVADGIIQRDRTLARGLDYYTGPVYETVVTEPNIGSLSGGGRYDELIGMFSGRPVPAVGVALGLERIIVVMEELGMLPSSACRTQVFVARFSAETETATLAATNQLREAGLRTRLSLKGGKIGKQLKTADRLGIPWALIVGPDEAASSMVQLKNLTTGEQHVLPVEDAVKMIGA